MSNANLVLEKMDKYTAGYDPNNLQKQFNQRRMPQGMEMGIYHIQAYPLSIQHPSHTTTWLSIGCAQSISNDSN